MNCPDARKPIRGSRAIQIITTALCVVFGAAIAVVTIQKAGTLYDEASYAYHGWAMLTQGWQPFLDFHMKILPLVHFLYGIPQAILGPDMMLARYTATFFTVLTVILAAIIARRLAGKLAAIMLLAMFVFNLTTAVKYYRALCMAPTAFFIVLALYWLTIPNARKWQQYAASLAIAAVVMCRHDLLPTAVILWAYLWFEQRQTQQKAVWAPIGTGILAIVAISIYYYTKAPTHFLNVMFGGIINPEAVVGGPYGSGAEPLTIATFIWHLAMMARAYTAPLLLLAPALGTFVCRGIGNKTEFLALCRRHKVLILLLLAAAANYLSHVAAVLLFDFRVYYLLDFYIFFPVAIAAAASFIHIARSYSVQQARAQYAAMGVFIIVAQLWINGIPAELQTSSNHMQDIRVGAEAIARHIPADEYIFSVDDPHQFLQAGRLMHPTLSYQLFHFVDTEDTAALIHNSHYYNKEILAELISQSHYAVLSDGIMNGWMLNSGRYDHGQELHDFILHQIEHDFTLIETVSNSYGGPTHIYKRHE